MEKRELGKTGMQVSVLGFGGAEIGYENASPESVAQLLGSALDAGLNVIDTAECYADSEEKIGRALSGRRDHYYLFTKCGHAAGFDLPDWDLRLLEQRPIANAAWRFNSTSAENASPPDYWKPYLERLQELDYEFLTGELRQSIATALRFTLSVAGVDTAIVGTTKPDRWQQNAELLEGGALSNAEFEAIRDRWRSVAIANWVGQG